LLIDIHLLYKAAHIPAYESNPLRCVS